MGKQIIGLKIGASQLAAARVASNGSPQLLQVAREPLTPGVVASGEIADGEALAAALKSFFAKHSLPTRGVRVGVASNRIGVRTIELSGIIDPKQLANAVRFRAQEALPIPLEEAVLDFQVLSEDLDEEGTPRKRVLLAVTYRDLVESYTQACRAAGLRLAGIDLEAFALLRALTPLAPTLPSESERSAFVAVSVGADRSIIAVGDGRSCEFTRVLDWGGHALTGLVASALTLDEYEAELVKQSLNIETNDVPEGLTAEQAERAREALRLGLQSFARELVSSLQFYQSQPGSLGLREVVFAGGSVLLGGFDRLIQRTIGVSVRVGDPLTAVAAAKRLEGGPPSPAHTIAIGLGIGL